ncbi:hypothetical protein Ga0100231_010440 [Opitutaceae bacterium TAV4]|nr:hypothetical protein Ga0100231_010440 [Opitutaceae bacterium TAV4]RRJ98763.1 hypothetical protein Ga0100230_010545 [Opitutaceae bacterium TAV3]
MNTLVDNRVQCIRKAVRTATGSDSPELSSTLRFLEQHGFDLHDEHEDLVLYRVYRDEMFSGEARTFAAMSPFSDLSYEDAIAATLIPEVADRLEMRISASYDATLRLHKAGVLHGDLHLDNIMWIADDPTAPVQPIDLASTVFKEDISAQEWDMGVFDDLNEFLREAGLLQLNQKRRIIGCCFDEARKLASELFPEDIATALRAL